MAWHTVADTSEFTRRDVVGRECQGRKLAVYRLGEAYYATSGLCTHGNASLCDGEVVDGLIECPLHFGYFEITSGKAQGAPVTIDLGTYPVRLEGSAIQVDLGPASTWPGRRVSPSPTRGAGRRRPSTCSAPPTT